MSLTRSEALQVLNDFLNDKISQVKVYEWALVQAVAKDYEMVAQNDPLLGETIQAFLDMSHQQGDYIPTRDDISYYQRCLQGQASFEPLSIRLEKMKEAQKKMVQEEKVKARQSVIVHKTFSRTVMRVYVIMFALTSLTVNIIEIIKPGFFKVGEALTHGQAFREALPHFGYVIFLLIPPYIVVNGFLYYLTLPVLFMGVIFYFYITVSIVLQLKLNPLLIVCFAPFALVPALLALWLVMTQKKN